LGRSADEARRLGRAERAPVRDREIRRARGAARLRDGNVLDVIAVEIARRVTDWPLAAIVYTDIATDGTMKGPNLDATNQIAAATSVPIVASGGVGTLDHLRLLRGLPLQGVIVGRALYEGAFTVEQAIQILET
jgi:phosphoribosylformimino-5-aminoimidazole carboxamide ribonucleotide (ProFAR) isomerase